MEKHLLSVLICWCQYLHLPAELAVNLNGHTICGKKLYQTSVGHFIYSLYKDINSNSGLLILSDVMPTWSPGKKMFALYEPANQGNVA